MRSTTLLTRTLAMLTALAFTVVLAPSSAAAAAADPAATFCRVNISSGATTCHESYDAMLRQTDDAVLLAIVYNWINQNPGGGALGLASDSACTPAYDNEPYKRFDHLDRETYDNGITVNNTISSYYLYSGCRLRLYDPVNLQAPYSSLLYADCDDLRTCSPGNWYDRAGSIAFT